MWCWTADVDETHEQAFVQPSLYLNYTFQLSQTHNTSSLSRATFTPTIDSEASAGIKVRQKKGEEKYWATLGVKRHADWFRLRNEPSSQRLTDRLFGSQRAVYLDVWKKEKNNQRGFVAQTSLLALSWRQRHWPVSPWCDALIYVTPAPPLSSGRVVTTGWGEQKHT